MISASTLTYTKQQANAHGEDGAARQANLHSANPDICSQRYHQRRGRNLVSRDAWGQESVYATPNVKHAYVTRPTEYEKPTSQNIPKTVTPNVIPFFSKRPLIRHKLAKPYLTPWGNCRMTRYQFRQCHCDAYLLFLKQDLHRGDG
jgi:hypothetical protein